MKKLKMHIIELEGWEDTLRVVEKEVNILNYKFHKKNKKKRRLAGYRYTLSNGLCIHENDIDDIKFFKSLTLDKTKINEIAMKMIKNRIDSNNENKTRLNKSNVHMKEMIKNIKEKG